MNTPELSRQTDTELALRIESVWDSLKIVRITHSPQQEDDLAASYLSVKNPWEIYAQFAGAATDPETEGAIRKAYLEGHVPLDCVAVIDETSITE